MGGDKQNIMQTLRGNSDQEEREGSIQPGKPSPRKLRHLLFSNSLQVSAQISLNRVRPSLSPNVKWLLPIPLHPWFFPFALPCFVFPHSTYLIDYILPNYFLVFLDPLERNSHEENMHCFLHCFIPTATEFCKLSGCFSEQWTQFHNCDKHFLFKETE